MRPSDFCNIDVNFEDYGGGAESILNPYESENAVREAILAYKNNKENMYD